MPHSIRISRLTLEFAYGQVDWCVVRNGTLVTNRIFLLLIALIGHLTFKHFYKLAEKISISILAVDAVLSSDDWNAVNRLACTRFSVSTKLNQFISMHEFLFLYGVPLCMQMADNIWTFVLNMKWISIKYMFEFQWNLRF